MRQLQHAGFIKFTAAALAALAMPATASPRLSDTQKRVSLPLPPQEARQLATTLQTLLQTPDIRITGAGSGPQERWEEIRTGFNLSPAELTRIRNRDTDSSNLKPAARTFCLTETATLTGRRSAQCVVNPPRATEAMEDWVNQTITHAGPRRSILKNSFIPPALDTRADFIITTFHEYFHAWDTTILRPRVQALTDTGINRDAYKDSAFVTDLQPDIQEEALADVAAAELYYRITPPAGRNRVMEQIRDWQAIRQLAYSSPFTVTGDTQKIFLKQQYTAAALGLWLQEASTRNADTFPVWTHPKLLPADIDTVGRTALDITGRAMAGVTVGTLAQQGRLNEALLEVMTDRVAACSQGPVGYKRDLDAEAARSTHLRAMASAPFTTPVMRAATASALLRLTQASHLNGSVIGAALSLEIIQDAPPTLNPAACSGAGAKPGRTANPMQIKPS